jgi:hypothetical protein
MHDAIRELAKPKPKELGAKVMLALAEVAAAAVVDRYGTARATCAYAPEGGEFEQLRSRGLVYFTARDWQDQLAHVSLSWQGRDLLGDGTSLADRRTAAGVEDPGEGKFAFAWLNGPFEVDAEGREALAARKADRAKALAETKAAKARREDSLKEVQGLTEGLGAEPIFLARQRVREQLGALKGPFMIDASHRVVDGAGTAVCSAHWGFGDDTARICALIAFALNFASFDDKSRPEPEATLPAAPPAPRPGLVGDAFSRDMAEARATPDLEPAE